MDKKLQSKIKEDTFNVLKARSLSKVRETASKYGIKMIKIKTKKMLIQEIAEKRYNYIMKHSKIVPSDFNGITKANYIFATR